MYEKFYHLRQKPFQLTPDPVFLYKSEKHCNALTYLEYGLSENVNIVVLTGEVGSGKTTTARYILNQLDDQLDPAMITNTNLSADELLRLIQHTFGIAGVNLDKAAVIDAIHRDLLERHEAGRHALLVIDEAQNLNAEVLEELRMLSNFQKERFALLQIMLVGQPELLLTLRKPSMRQFSQRVAVHYHLTALGREETGAYIDYRLQIAGGDKGVFTPGAVDMIFSRSGGIPRSINLLCDAALVYGFVDETSRITQDIISQIIDDRLGVGIACDKAESIADPLAVVAPESPADTAPVSEANDNIRTEAKGRIGQLQTDLDEKERDPLNQIKALLDEVRGQNESLEQKVTMIDKRILSLGQFLKKLAKRKINMGQSNTRAKQNNVHAR
jgi:general secretion pathway protein A